MMRYWLLGFLVWFSFSVKGQISDTGSLRAYINTKIITNGNRSITAQNLNAIFNAYLNIWPNDSLVVTKGTYDTLYFYKSGQAVYYLLLSGEKSGWNTAGNTGTSASSNFIGTTDSVPLTFRVNNQTAGVISPYFNVTSYGYRAGTPATLNNLYTSVFGYEALSANQGAGNSAFGSLAMTANTSGVSNSAFGNVALERNTSGSDNVALGANAIANNQTGSNNVVVGYAALGANISGGYNIAIGSNAMHNSDAGNYNTVVGYFASQSLTSSDSNVLIGAMTVRSLKTAKGNIVLGSNPSTGIFSTGYYNTIIGQNISLPAYLSGNIIIADGKGNRRINVDSAGNLMVNTTTPIAHNTFIGTGAFTDTLTATTMLDADSSNRVATTAWTKNHFGQIIGSGTYIPQKTSIGLNVDSLDFGACFYQRIANIVNVDGRFHLSTMDSLSGAFLFSLPIGSTFVSSDDCSGVISGYTNPGNVGAIVADVATGYASVVFKPSDARQNYVTFHLTYIIH